VDGWVKAIEEQLMKEAQEIMNQTAPFPFDFTLTDVAGQSISLASLQGKVVIVDFWGTWCPPCVAEIPSFIRLQNEYGPQGFQMVGLNVERVESDEEATKMITQFMQDKGMNYPCALAPEAVQQLVPDLRAFPTTLFIDKSGKVRAKLEGLHDYTLLESLVKVLLTEPTPPPVDPGTTPAPAPADSAPADAATPPADTPPADAPPADAPPAEPAQETPPPTDDGSNQ